jgi:hypothetical protein
VPTFTRKIRGVDPDREVVVFASRLPLQRRRDAPGFLADTLNIKQQLDARIADPDEGLLWYALRADLIANTYWTTSAWRDGEALRSFVISEPHSSIMRARRGTLGSFDTTRWCVAGSDLPIAHAQTVQRLTNPG